MRAVDKIRRSINQSKYRTFFTREELARFGDSSTITRSLQVLVKNGEVTKLYPGTYALTDEYNKNFRLQYLTKNQSKALRKLVNIHGKTLNSSLASKIREVVKKNKPGTFFDVEDFSDLASPRNIKILLDTLVEAHEMFCPCRGMYCAWIYSRFGKSAPTIEDFIRGYVEKTGETVVEDGCFSANAFHFTTQFPVRIHFLTSGRSRILMKGKEDIPLTHGEDWIFFEPNTQCGRMVRAIDFMSKWPCGFDFDDIDRVRFGLSKSELEHLSNACGQFPSHIRKVIMEACNV